MRLFISISIWLQCMIGLAFIPLAFNYRPYCILLYPVIGILQYISVWTIRLSPKLKRTDRGLQDWYLGWASFALLLISFPSLVSAKIGVILFAIGILISVPLFLMSIGIVKGASIQIQSSSKVTPIL